MVSVVKEHLCHKTPWVAVKQGTAHGVRAEHANPEQSKHFLENNQQNTEATAFSPLPTHVTLLFLSTVSYYEIARCSLTEA